MKYTLKMLRASKNWSQLTASKAIGVSVDTWGNWERGKTEPTVTQAYQIATTFGVSIDDIIFLHNIAV